MSTRILVSDRDYEMMRKAHEDITGLTKKQQRLLNSNLDIRPLTQHIYDHGCRCFGCQSFELGIQESIVEGKKYGR